MSAQPPPVDQTVLSVRVEAGARRIVELDDRRVVGLGINTSERPVPVRDVCPDCSACHDHAHVQPAAGGCPDLLGSSGRLCSSRGRCARRSERLHSQPRRPPASRRSRGSLSDSDRRGHLVRHAGRSERRCSCPDGSATPSRPPRPLPRLHRRRSGPRPRFGSGSMRSSFAGAVAHTPDRALTDREPAASGRNRNRRDHRGTAREPPPHPRRTGGRSTRWRPG